MLEMERSSSQQNLESLVELATNQKITASEKYDELYGELLSAKEDAKVAHDHISEKSPTGENQDFLVKLYADVEEVMLEAENSKILVESLSSVVDELFKCLSDVSDFFVDLGCSVSESSVQLKCTKSNFEELQSWFRCEIGEHKNEKLLLLNESLVLRARNEELNLKLQNSSDELTKISEQHEAERFELHSQILKLHKEVSNLSTSSLARERESTRKDFEKTKVKLRERESKLKNIMQEKTKLEGEKAFAERNARLLRDQKAILERDVNKQNYSVGRRHDPSSDRQSSISFDSKGSRAPAAAELAMQAECERLEVILFEAETTISSLEEDLTIIHQERDEANCRAESLASELDSLSDELKLSNKELEMLRDEVSRLKLGLEESKSQNLIVERSVSMLEKDKEELAMQLTDALLAMEEEKAIWSAKEKACVEAFEMKINLSTAEISQLARGISEAKEALEISRKKCSALEDKLRISEEKSVSEKEYHTVKGLEIQSLRNDVVVVHDRNSTLEEDKTNYEKERLKLRMRLRGTQMKLDGFREKFQEKAAELDYAHGEYEKSAVKMKDELAKRGVEILNLRRDLALHRK
ncbi:hypothetical protein LIER_15428 [Lithospermum erythrorhizon]|uniref:Uncharacterized protein n=1 Tax=Lithospermum erythrorhizon TaxID=34254 RepID=A0AAV3Q582_LITER